MRIIFMGTPDFAVPSLEQLVRNGHEVVLAVTQPDKPKGRGNQLIFRVGRRHTLQILLVFTQNEVCFVYGSVCNSQ